MTPPHERHRAQVATLAGRFRSAAPYPHLVFQEFLDPALARTLEAEFPEPGDEWIHYKHINENKLGQNDRTSFPPRLAALVDELNAPAFLEFLEELTGIGGLLADPVLDGGGLHQTERGGFLNMHADFSVHHYRKAWQRRLNLILYLNEGWDPAWGGALELWDAQMKSCVARIQPELNTALLFLTDRTSFHGYPDPLTCPPGVRRKSLALYYYTEAPAGAALEARSTDYRARPGEHWKAPLIWLDKQALHLYSRTKSRFGLSDDLASRLLRSVWGKRK